MRRLVSVLGMPQHRFASIHVVGTNGKSSTARTAAALLAARGVRSGAYLSPHLERWSERVLIGTQEIDDAAFAAAIERVATAVTAVDRSLDADDAVTQFELLTAAAFVALAQARVEVAVIEAGLGGRLDATNVIPSSVVALPSISLEHTELLGDSETKIAAEKLAVLRDHSTLVLGPVSAAVEAEAERAVSAHAGRLVRAADNTAVAVAAVEAIQGPLEPELVTQVTERLAHPGVLERYGSAPPLLLDAAHNPGAARWLAAELEREAGGRPVFACLAMLEGKDVEGFAEALAPALAGAVCTQLPEARLRGIGRPGSRTVPASALAAALERAGLGAVEVEAEPERALERARELAKSAAGMALVSGTHYLLPYVYG
jgi:dihydrofolate synthase/folylpolyglutamate synthase